MAKKLININKVPKDKTTYTRPEGAGNFDNMDDMNIVNQINMKIGTSDLTPTDDKHIVNKKYVDDEIDDSFSGMSITNDGTKTTFLGTAGDYNRIGDAGTTNHLLASNDDLLVTGKLEVDGIPHFDALGSFYSGILSTFLDIYNFPQSKYYWVLRSGTDDGLKLCVGDDDGYANRNFIITDKANRNIDHDHNTLSANPTMFFHSVTNPNTDNTQWMSLTHDQTDGVITTGTGAINLAPASGLKINGTAGWTGTFTNGDGDTVTVTDGIITGVA